MEFMTNFLGHMLIVTCLIFCGKFKLFSTVVALHLYYCQQNPLGWVFFFFFGVVSQMFDIFSTHNNIV